MTNKPRCEVCGKHKCTEEELLHLMDDDPECCEFKGMKACPDCVFEICVMHRNPLTKKLMGTTTSRRTKPIKRGKKQPQK